MTTKTTRPRALVKPAATSAAAKPKLAEPTPPAKPDQRPSAVRYRYRLEQYTVERLKDGWWILSDAVKKQGPFATAQDVCIAIARELCTELSNRHHALSSFHGVKPADPLYGLPEAPQLYQPRTVGDAP